MAVRSCEINVFKHASGLFFRGKCHSHIRLNALFRSDGDNLSRLYIPDKLCTDCIKCTGLGCNDICIVSFSDAKRLKTKWVSGCNKLSRAHNKERISALNYLHCSCNGIFNRMTFKSFTGNYIADNLAVDCCLKDCATLFKTSADFKRIGKVAVMGN